MSEHHPQLTVRVYPEIHEFLFDLAEERDCSVDRVVFDALFRFRARVLDEQRGREVDETIARLVSDARPRRGSIIEYQLGNENDSGPPSISVSVTHPGTEKQLLGSIDGCGAVSHYHSAIRTAL